MKEFIQEIRDFLTPKQPASWQTLLLLSLFSSFIAFFTTSIAQNIISSCGWIFLILAAWWFVYEPPIKKALTFPGIFTQIFIGPWIVAALICLFLFGSWGNYGQLTAITPPAFIVWPLLSAVIGLIPNFIKTNGDSKTPEFTWPGKDKRQGMVLFLMSHLLVACWFQFYFLLQGWLSVYPSLLSDDFTSSSFVVRVSNFDRGSPLGKDVLNTAEAQLRSRLEKQTWGEIERWFFENKAQKQWVNDLESDVSKQLTQRWRFFEGQLWDLQGKVTTDRFDTGAMYNVQLDAIWQGPSSQQSGYYLTKTCEITPSRQFYRKAGVTLPSSRVIGRLKCSEVSKPIEIKPDSKPVGT
ncbi:DUF5357 family protein [Alkalinema pantanalense CENA528]|uniref:DUF5357 family protein n=1 Tax=Alkalinema pantanalense TaxID=1620705 RepID=UPI003D6E3F97